MRRREESLTRSLAESEAAFRRQYDRAERAEAEVERLRALCNRALNELEDSGFPAVAATLRQQGGITPGWREGGEDL